MIPVMPLSLLSTTPPYNPIHPYLLSVTKLICKGSPSQRLVGVWLESKLMHESKRARERERERERERLKVHSVQRQRKKEKKRGCTRMTWGRDLMVCGASLLQQFTTGVIFERKQIDFRTRRSLHASHRQTHLFVFLLGGAKLL